LSQAPPSGKKFGGFAAAPESLRLSGQHLHPRGYASGSRELEAEPPEFLKGQHGKPGLIAMCCGRAARRWPNSLPSGQVLGKAKLRLLSSINAK